MGGFEGAVSGGEGRDGRGLARRGRGRGRAGGRGVFIAREGAYDQR